MAILFVKAVGAGNDFLLSWAADVPPQNRSLLAKAICDRNHGIGADGWYVVTPGASEDQWDASIHLYNSDGSEAEISGNGTRAVAAWLASKWPGRTQFRMQTGAGLRMLTLLEVRGNEYLFSMTMGHPEVFPEEELAIAGPIPIRVKGRRVDVGNPQFAVRVDGLDFPWKERGAQLESHDAFPQRSNISFYRALDRHRVEARFFERGAGATLSSGTGSTGVVAASLAEGLVDLPVTVVTEAGDLEFRNEGAGLLLDGWAKLVGEGLFYWPQAEPEGKGK
ncbi:MAG: diaminopimelate epimerase [Bryobacterales bacterium]|nr:diaminopimelate epimerase [Bryobacterales bacterium]